MLELVEEALDSIAQPVGYPVVRYGNGAASRRRDHCLSAALGDEVAYGIGVVGSIGDHAPSLHATQQVGHRGYVMGLACGQNEAQRSALRIGQCMDFGGQSSSGSPQSLVLGPPFPPAACW